MSKGQFYMSSVNFLISDYALTELFPFKERGGWRGTFQITTKQYTKFYEGGGQMLIQTNILMVLLFKNEIQADKEASVS